MQKRSFTSRIEVFQAEHAGLSSLGSDESQFCFIPVNKTV